MFLKLSKEKGIALVAGMIFILTVMMIVFSFILMIQTEVKEETLTEKFKNALSNAEVGLARTKWLLQHDDAWRQHSLDNATSTIDLEGTITNSASYTVYLSWIQGGTDILNPNPEIPPGSITWRYSLPRTDDNEKVDPLGSYPYDIQYLDNGHILITEMHAKQRVLELIPDFKNDKVEEYWTYNNNEKMTSAERMPNGNTLIVEPHTYGGWVYEIDANATKQWEWKYPYWDPKDNDHTNSWMQDADLLPDGNILITMRYAKSPYKVIVVNYATGEIEWSYDANLPTDADYLPNGNILITEKEVPGTNTGRIIEVNYKTKVIEWKVEGLNNPYDAERLPNGHTVICESGGYSYWDRTNKGRISEVDENGEKTSGSPLITGLSAPHAIDIVEQTNGDLDILVANTDSRGERGNEILLVKGWSRGGNRVRIASIGDYLGCKNTVIVEANLDRATGVLTNITWKEEKGVPKEYR